MIWLGLCFTNIELMTTGRLGGQEDSRILGAGCEISGISESAPAVTG